MGLDQWAFSTKNKAVLSRFEYNQDYKEDEIFYWREDRFVHNWMEKLYESLPEDINRLEEDTKSDKIKEYDTDGIFFGE